MIEYLLKACEVCERGAAVAKLRQVVFSAGRIFAFNGIYQYQAPSGLPEDEFFAVSEERLASALRTCAEDATIGTTPQQLSIKSGPLRVRIKKVEPQTNYELITLPKSAAKQKADEIKLLDVLRTVHPFVADDASRPWATAVLLREGYAWATNNLSLVRSRLLIPALLEGVKIPSPAMDFICDLPSLDYYHIDENGRMILSFGRSLVRFPQSRAEWPDVARFFDGMPDPQSIPAIPEELKLATQQVQRFADRFVSLDQLKVSGSTETMETEYEIDLANCTGQYNAKLLSLILEHATQANFSLFPDPIHFSGPNIEGRAVGIRPAASPT